VLSYQKDLFPVVGFVTNNILFLVGENTNKQEVNMKRNHPSKMSKYLNRFTIFVLLFIFTCCKGNDSDELTLPIDFKEYFAEIKNLNLVPLLEGIKYFGQTREGMKEIYYFDSTEALFWIRNYENIDIIKKGSGKYDEEKIVSDIGKLIKIYKRMHLKCISCSDIGQDRTICIWFDINIIKKETLPHYKHPMDTVFSKKFPLEFGELDYSLNGKFEEYQLYKNTQPLKLEDRWYFMYW